jgi:aldose 1-epimerase
MNLETIVLQAGSGRVEIAVAAGGRLSSWNVGGIELLWPRIDSGSDPFHWGSFVMAPYAGRIRRGVLSFQGKTYPLPIAMDPHAIHGSVYDVAWIVEECTSTTALLSADLGSRWPFPGRISQHVSLEAHGDQSGSLHQELVLSADVDMPVTMGWHPWFPKVIEGPSGPVRGVWSFDRTGVSMFERDAEGIPTGAMVPVPEGPWDDCFEGVGAVAVEWPGLVSIEVTHDCPVVVLFDGLDHAMCVEPQTGPPDVAAVWPDRCVVPGGGQRRASTTWSWQLP